MRRNGFSLIEMVITLLLVGVLSAMVVPYFLSGVTTAADPLNDMPTPLSVQTIVARIAADYSSNGTFLNDLSQFSSSITTGKYGITASQTVVKDLAFKFDPADILTALKVTVTDNASGRSATIIFTRQQ